MLNYKTVYLASSATIRDVGGGGATAATLVNQKGGSIVIQGAYATLDIVLNNTGTIVVPSASTLAITAGSNLQSATLTVNGTLLVKGGKRGPFYVKDSSGLSLAAAGNISLYNSTVYFPKTLSVTSLAGTVVCLSNGTAVVGGSGTPTYTFGKVWVRNGGTFSSTVTAARVVRLTLNKGGTVKVTGGQITCSSKLNWYGGTIKGNGYFVNSNTTLISSAATKFLLVRFSSTPGFTSGALVP